MATMNQAPLSPKGFPLQQGDSAIGLSSHQQQPLTWHKTVLALAAWFEILVGASFILVPDTQSQFLFAVTLEGTGVHFARLAGVALIALGIACLPSKRSETRQVAARVLLVFNLAATILFASIALATTVHGVMLWPIVIVHAVIAISLVRIAAGIQKTR